MQESFILKLIKFYYLAPQGSPLSRTGVYFKCPHTATAQRPESKTFRKGEEEEKQNYSTRSTTQG